MGWFVEYECDSCHFEEHYCEGWGWMGMTEGEPERLDKMNEEFKQDILKGKYGEKLRKMTAKHKDLLFSRNKVTFQCNDCKYTGIFREKHISQTDFNEHEGLSIEIEIPQRCPKCKGDNFRRLKDLEDDNVIFCPKCKKKQFRLRQLGCWD